MIDMIRKETIRCYYGEYKAGEWNISKQFYTTTNVYDARGILLSSEVCRYYENGVVSSKSVAVRRTEKGRFVYRSVLSDGRITDVVIRDKEGRMLQSNANGLLYRCSYDEQGRVEKEGDDGLWEDVYVRDDDGMVVQTYHVRHDQDPYIAQHYYSRDFMGNIVETAVNDKGEHVESILHDKAMKAVIEKIDKKNGSIETYSTDGQKICGMLCDNAHPDHLNHYELYICDYDFMGNWVTRILPRFLNVPKSQRGKLNYQIEIRDIEYEDFLNSMDFCMFDSQW